MPRILLVEDEKQIASLIKAVLRDHEVTFFDNAEQALEYIRKSYKSGTPFDWVITDKGLAGQMDGFGLAEGLQKEHLGRPFVTLLTGSAVKVKQNNSADQLRQKGIHQVMGKPFNIAELTDSVRLAREFGKQAKIPQV